MLSVPGVSCAFLGPADLGFSFGLYEQSGYDLGAMLQSPRMDEFHAAVASACRKHGVAAGAFCLGRERAAALGARFGFEYVAFDTDLNALITYAGAGAAALRGGG